MSWESTGLAWADALSAPNTVTAYIDHVLEARRVLQAIGRTPPGSWTVV
jgi:hypothetical protein